MRQRANATDTTDIDMFDSEWRQRPQATPRRPTEQVISGGRVREDRRGTAVRRHCRHHVVLWCLLLVTVGLLVAAWLSVNRQPAKLLLVVVPALRWDYLDRVPARDTPFFTGMVRGGSRAEWLESGCLGDSVAITTSMLTGLYPDQHGVLGEHFLDRKHGDLHVQEDSERAVWWGAARPVWFHAAKRMRDAAVYDVIGACARFDGYDTRYCRTPNALEHEQLLQATDQHIAEHHGQQLQLDLEDALLKLATKHYHLAVVQTDALRHMVQRHGATSATTLQAVITLDKQLSAILTNSRTRAVGPLNVVVVSPGGLTDTQHMHVIVLEEHLPDPEQVPITAAGNGGYCLLYAADSNIDTIYHSLANATGLRVYRGDQLPGRYRLAHAVRGPALLVVAQPGFYIEYSRPLAVAAAGGFDSTHDNEEDSVEIDDPVGSDASVASDMRGVLMARGPDIKAGQLVSPVHAVDIHALLAHLLWLDNTGSGQIEHLLPMLAR